jgi:hypothetical protein
VSYSGRFELMEYLSHVAKITNLPEWEHISKILSDFTSLVLSYDKKILDPLMLAREQFNIRNKTHVYLVNTPMETALLHLYIKKTGEKNYNYYSTLEKALGNLDIAEEENNIKRVLATMKQQV